MRQSLSNKLSIMPSAYRYFRYSQSMINGDIECELQLDLSKIHSIYHIYHSILSKFLQSRDQMNSDFNQINRSVASHIPLVVSRTTLAK